MSVVHFGPKHQHDSSSKNQAPTDNKKHKGRRGGVPPIPDVDFRYTPLPKLNGGVYEWDGLFVDKSFNPKKEPMGRGVFAKTDLKAGLLIPYRGKFNEATDENKKSTGYGLLEGDQLIDANPELEECKLNACIAGLINEAPVGRTYNCMFIQMSPEEKFALEFHMMIPPEDEPPKDDFQSYVLLMCNVIEGAELYVHYGGDCEEEYDAAPETDKSTGFDETRQKLESLVAGLTFWPKLQLSRFYRYEEKFVLTPLNFAVVISNKGTPHNVSPIGTLINITAGEDPFRPSPNHDILENPVKDNHATIEYISDECDTYGICVKGGYYLQKGEGITYVDGKLLDRPIKLQQNMVVSFGYDGNYIEPSEIDIKYDYMFMFKINILNKPSKTHKPKADKQNRKPKDDQQNRENNYNIPTPIAR